MTDLRDYGVDVDEPEEDPDEGDDGGFGGGEYEYRMGRCRAISVSGERCSSPSKHGADRCHTHEAHDATTIDAPPRKLVEATKRRAWHKIENERVKRAVEAVSGGENA